MFVKGASSPTYNELVVSCDTTPSVNQVYYSSQGTRALQGIVLCEYYAKCIASENLMN